MLSDVYICFDAKLAFVELVTELHTRGSSAEQYLDELYER